MATKVKKSELKLVEKASFALAELCHKFNGLPSDLWERAVGLEGALNRFYNQSSRG